MTTIYTFCNSRTAKGDIPGLAISDGGVIVGSHVSSCLGWLERDLQDKRNYHDRYPDGFVVEWVPMEARDTHVGLQNALAKARSNAVQEG